MYAWLYVGGALKQAARHVGADTDVLFVTEDDEDAVCARGCGSCGTSKSERAFRISVS